MADRLCIGVMKSSILSFKSLSAWVRGPGTWEGILGHIVVVAMHRRSRMSNSWHPCTHAISDSQLRITPMVGGPGPEGNHIYFHAVTIHERVWSDRHCRLR